MALHSGIEPISWEELYCITTVNLAVVQLGTLAITDSSLAQVIAHSCYKKSLTSVIYTLKAVDWKSFWAFLSVATITMVLQKMANCNARAYFSDSSIQ